jgi:hypothetical protein
MRRGTTQMLNRKSAAKPRKMLVDGALPVLRPLSGDGTGDGGASGEGCCRAATLEDGPSNVARIESAVAALPPDPLSLVAAPDTPSRTRLVSAAAGPPGPLRTAPASWLPTAGGECGDEGAAAAIPPPLSGLPGPAADGAPDEIGSRAIFGAGAEPPESRIGWMIGSSGVDGGGGTEPPEPRIGWMIGSSGVDGGAGGEPPGGSSAVTSCVVPVT